MPRTSVQIPTWAWVASVAALAFWTMLPGAQCAGQTQSSNQPDFAETPLEQLGKVQVYSVSKRMQSVSEAPSFATVITGDEIRKHGYRTLAEVLQSVAGFYVDYDRNYSYVGVRGFGRPGDYNSRILVLLDGHRLNENVYDASYVGTEFPLDLAVVERVEIARGPSSALYGANAFFAVVNVVTAPPERRTPGVEVSFETGSYGSYAGTARASGQFGSTWFAVTGSAYESAGPSPLYIAVPGAGQAPVAVHHADDDSFRTLLVSAARHQTRFQGFYSGRWKGIPTGAFGTVLNDARTRTLDRRAYGDLAYSRRVHDHWAVSTHGYFDYYGYKGAYVYAIDSGGTEVDRDYAVGTWWGGDVEFRYEGWKRHTWQLGGEARHNRRQDQGYFVEGGPVVFRDARSSHNWAVYTQDEFVIVKPLIAYLGVRHDRYTQFGGTTNPRLGLVYRAWRNTALKFVYGTAFRAPNCWELYYTGELYNPNPFLKPEKVRTLEAIAEQGIGASVRLVLAAFTNRISQLIDQATDQQGKLIFRNLGRATTRGIEAQAEVNRGGYEGRLGYTVQVSRDAASHTSLSNSPRHLAKLSLIAPVFRRRLFAGAGAQFTSRRFASDGDRVGTSTVINLTLFAPRVRPELDLTFSVYNLLDRRYAAAETDPTIAPVVQDGRTLRLKVTYRF